MTIKLLTDRDTLRDQLGTQIEKAGHMSETGVDTEVLLRGYESWDNRNRILLENSFSKGTFLEANPSNTYADFTSLTHGLMIPQAADRSVAFSDELRSDIVVKKNRLQDLLDNLDLYTSSETVPALDIDSSSPETIFIIHGHATELRLEVEVLIHKNTNIAPVVLMSEANRGMTVIEKLEQHLGKSRAFAIVLVTGDDVGRVGAMNEDANSRRARQNVILEWGYAMAALGRSNVVVLHEVGVELPSDVGGVAYYSIGDRDWKMRILGELQAAGVDVKL